MKLLRNEREEELCLARPFNENQRFSISGQLVMCFASGPILFFLPHSSFSCFIKEEKTNLFGLACLRWGKSNWKQGGWVESKEKAFDEASGSAVEGRSALITHNNPQMKPAKKSIAPFMNSFHN